MFDKIEEFQTESEKLENMGSNLRSLGEMIPSGAYVVVNLADNRDNKEFPLLADCIEDGLKEALDLPESLNINLNETSIVLFNETLRKGIFLVSRLPEKQSRMGLPEFLPDNSRFYYGAIWQTFDEADIFSSLGNSVFEKESHPMKGSDINALNAVLRAFTQFATKRVEDPKTGKTRMEISNIRMDNRGNFD